MRRTSIIAALAAILALATAGAAIADPAPPSNDSRDSPVVLGPLPATVSGTTVGATVAPTDPSSSCADEGGSVWYQVAVGAQAPPKLAVQVEANGELDAAVDVFVKQRSQNIPVTCQRTDKHGEAVFAFTPQKQTTYLIRVAQLANSDSGTFSLHVFQPPPAAKAPGTPLARPGRVGLAGAGRRRLLGVFGRADRGRFLPGQPRVSDQGLHALGDLRAGHEDVRLGNAGRRPALSGVSAIHAASDRPLQPARPGRRVRSRRRSAITCSWRPPPPPRQHPD